MKHEEIERFQKWLQEKLSERNITANQLAKKAGISHSVFVRVREGKLPKGETCIKIAECSRRRSHGGIAGCFPAFANLRRGRIFQPGRVFIFNRLPPKKKRLAIYIIEGFAKNSLDPNEQDQEISAA